MSDSRRLSDHNEGLDLAFLLQLPTEIIFHIFLFLPKERWQFVSIALSCHALFNFVNRKPSLSLTPKFDYLDTGNLTVIDTGGYILDVIISPNGKFVAKIQGYSKYDSEMCAKLYDVNTGKQLHSFRINICYRQIFFMKDEKHLVIIGYDYIDVYNIENDSLFCTFDFKALFSVKNLCAASISETEFLLKTLDGRLICYNINTRQATTIKDTDLSDLDAYKIDLSDDGNHAILFTYDPEKRMYYIKFLDISTMLISNRFSLREDPDCVDEELPNQSFKFSSDLKLLFYGYNTRDGKSHIKKIDFDKKYELSLIPPINCRFQYFSAANKFLLRVTTKEGYLDDGFIIVDAYTRRKVGFVPSDCPSLAHMNQTGDQILIVSKKIRSKKYANLDYSAKHRYDHYLETNYINVYKFKMLDLNNESIPSTMIPYRS